MTFTEYTELLPQEILETIQDIHTELTAMDFAEEIREVKTYAGKGVESASSRPCSHDLQYSEGEYLYIDSYLGGNCFAGEEAVWQNGVPVWSMNYAGKVTGEAFSGDFLKEALKRVPSKKPYRGPEYYEEGLWTYRCRSEETPEWFQGYENISFRGKQVYECFFHGSAIV